MSVLHSDTQASTPCRPPSLQRLHDPLRTSLVRVKNTPKAKHVPDTGIRQEPVSKADCLAERPCVSVQHNPLEVRKVPCTGHPQAGKGKHAGNVDAAWSVLANHRGMRASRS